MNGISNGWMSSYLLYYHEDPTHLGTAKDSARQFGSQKFALRA
jgi:hypothetical protein